MNCVIYCRVSTKEQVKEGLSLQNQQKECEKYAQNLGYKISERFIEKGESAKTSDRTKLIEMLTYCADNKGKIDYLVVYKLDRFSRRTEDHFMIKAMLIKHGVRLISVTEPIGEDSAQSSLMETILAGFAQFDNDIRTERSKVGMHQRVKEGRWVFGRIPLGFKADKDENKKTILVKEEETSKIVERAFIEYSTGLYSQGEILKLVNNAGLRSKKGLEISKQTINNMLKNPVYAGYIPNPWDDKLEEGLHEGIVSKEIFSTCQAVMRGFKPSRMPRQRYNPEFPVRGLLRCPVCERPLTGSKSTGKSKKYGYYHCYKCSGIRFNSDQANKEFIKVLEDIKPTESYVKDFKSICMDVWENDYKLADSERRRVAKELAELEDKKDKIIDMRALKEIDEGDFEKRMIKVKAEILQKEELLVDLKIKEYDIEALLGYAEWFLVRTEKIWKMLEPNLQQKFQQFIFPEGLAYNENGFVGTPVLSPVYAVFNASATDKSTMVVPRGIEPLLPG
jgi:site-specific DNA recombinase